MCIRDSSQGLGYRTLLLDFDLRFGDAHELVGVPGALAVDEALASPARLEGLAPDGLVPAVLAAPKRLEDAEAVVREAPRLLDDLQGRFDVVVANTCRLYTSDTMFDAISTTWTESSGLSAASPDASLLSPAAPNIIDVMSKPVLWICRGYSESVSSSTDSM